MTTNHDEGGKGTMDKTPNNRPEELLPCPFCGSSAHMGKSNSLKDSVFCDGCIMNAPIDIWQTRHTPKIDGDKVVELVNPINRKAFNVRPTLIEGTGSEGERLEIVYKLNEDIAKAIVEAYEKGELWK